MAEGRLAEATEIGEGQVQPAGTKVTTSKGAAVNLKGPEQEDPPKLSLTSGIIPTPESPPQKQPEPEPPAQQESTPTESTQPELGLTEAESVVLGEDAIRDASAEGVPPEQAVAVAAQRAEEAGPQALQRLREAPIESLDWKDKLAVAFVSLAGGAVLGEAVGVGATTGALAGGAAGFGELDRIQRQDAAQTRQEAQEQRQLQQRLDLARFQQANKKSSTKFQAKAVQFADGTTAFGVFDPSQGKIFDSEGNDITGKVTPIDVTVGEVKQRQIKRQEKLDDAILSQRLKQQFSTKPKDASGKPLDDLQSKRLADLTKKEDNVRFIRKALGSKVKQFDKAIKSGNEDLAVTLGNNMGKILNSEMGADAVGAEEAKRLLAFLEFQVLNFTEPGAVFGRDLEAFRDQLQATVDSLDETASQLESDRMKITGAKKRPSLPVIETRSDFDALDVGDEFIHKDGTKRVKTSPSGFK